MKNFKYSTSIILLLFILLNTSTAFGQAKLSGAASVGYAPLLTYGGDRASGVVLGIYGELQVKQFIGRLQYSPALTETIADESFQSGNNFHGSLGYSFPINDKTQFPVMIGGGATTIWYDYGKYSDTYWDASPQIGITLAPYYELTDHISVQLNMRYLKGFEASQRSRSIDIADISVAARLTL
ncbi:hypothetical protein [Jiulongibacter sp. NS-SX5]|uniref:hypothetical protein n=1 Tax=Jiulongibacter sp. NS-SX5 TaxID=3463854 RepID=UPI0040599416